MLSRAFRRRPGAVDPAATLLRRLVGEHVPLGVPGIVYQELLSGLREPAQAARLRDLLLPFPLLLAERVHHELAATIATACRRRGVATSAPDALIAALTARDGATLLTSDQDFARMAACHPFDVQLVP